MSFYQYLVAFYVMQQICHSDTSSPSKYPSKSPTAHPIPVGVTVETGSSGFTTYYEGNGPIIFLSQHGGDQTGSINERHDGCYTVTGTPKCLWTDDTCTPTANKCEAKKIQDSDTKDIAQCLHSRTTFTENSKTITSSLIINELHRNRLDANRQQEEAAQGDTDALKAWNEIHKDDNTGFVWKAKTNAKVTSSCGFGIIFDIHGQGFNDYNHLSYRLTEKHLGYVDDKISAVGAYTSKTYYKKSSSIKWLIDNNRQTIDNDYADIVRGPHSLGSILEDKGPGYKIIPSDSIPNAIIPLATDSDFFYYSGGFSLKYHGSSYYNHVDDINQGDGKYYTPNTKSTNTVDVIQIEVNSAIRTDETKRDQFCTDLSDAIVTFVKYWYKTSDCNPPSSAMTNIENGDNNTNNHHSDSGNNERKYIQSIVIVACTIFIVSVCCISGMCMIRKKSNVKAYTGVDIVKDADKMHTNSIEMNQTDTIIKN